LIFNEEGLDEVDETDNGVEKYKKRKQCSES